MKKILLLFVCVSLVLAVLPLYVRYMQNETVLSQPEPTDTLSSVAEQASVVVSGPATEPDEEEIAVCMATSGTVVNMSLADYVIGAVAGEMPALYEEEALKAQAAASMNLARLAMQQGTSDSLGGGHISSSAAVDQAYLTPGQMQDKWGDDFETYYNRIALAVQAVEGYEIVYEDALCRTCFHAVSAGRTENSENVWSSAVPYLTAVDSSFDSAAEKFSVSVQIHADSFAQGLADYGFEPEQNARHWVGESTYSPSGTLLELEVGNITVTGQQLRKAFGLRSAAIEVIYEDGEFILRTNGYGHGVGMSQYGAQQMALQGYTWQDIIRHYYTGVEIRQRE